jgi:hypothetical protein
MTSSERPARKLKHTRNSTHKARPALYEHAASSIRTLRNFALHAYARSTSDIGGPQGFNSSAGAPAHESIATTIWRSIQRPLSGVRSHADDPTASWYNGTTVGAPLSVSAFVAMIGAAAYVLFLWAGSSGFSWSPSRRGEGDQRRVTVAEKLATMDTGILHPDPHLVGPFNVHLNSLEWKCKQSRASTPNLGDITVVVQRLLVNRGRRMSLLQVLEAMDSKIPDGLRDKMDCADTTAVVETVIGGQSPATPQESSVGPI